MLRPGMGKESDSQNLMACINLVKLTGYFIYYQVQHSKILRGDYVAFMYFVRISEQTVTFAL